MSRINWEYFTTLYEVNTAISVFGNNEFSGLYGFDADKIISITFNSNLNQYVVIWRMEDE